MTGRLWKSVRRLRFVASVLALCGALPVHAQQVVIDDRFAAVELDWEGLDRAIVRWRPVLIDGRIAVCGAYSGIGNEWLNGNLRDYLLRTSVYLDGRPIMRNLTYFPNFSSAAYRSQLRGRLANCRVSGTAGISGDLKSVDIRFVTSRKWEAPEEVIELRRPCETCGG